MKSHLCTLEIYLLSRTFKQCIIHYLSFQGISTSIQLILIQRTELNIFAFFVTWNHSNKTVILLEDKLSLLKLA